MSGGKAGPHPATGRGYYLRMFRRSAIALAMLVCGVLTLAQSVPPAVNPPNPYTTIDRWGMLPAGRQWGGVSAIDIDRDGRSVRR